VQVYCSWNSRFALLYFLIDTPCVSDHIKTRGLTFEVELAGLLLVESRDFTLRVWIDEALLRGRTCRSTARGILVNFL
jgi:hypothetical protein